MMRGTASLDSQQMDLLLFEYNKTPILELPSSDHHECKLELLGHILQNSNSSGTDTNSNTDQNAP